MEEIILKELIGKVSEQDKALRAVQGEVRAIPDHGPALLQIDQRIDGVCAEVGSLPKRISLPEAELSALGRQLEYHCKLLATPQKQEVHHEHHVTKALWISIGLVALCLVLLVLLVNAYSETRGNAASDVKYRYLKVSGGAGVVRILDHADSVYLADPGGVEKWVREEEETREKERERIRRLEEKREEVREI